MSAVADGTQDRACCCYLLGVNDKWRAKLCKLPRVWWIFVVVAVVVGLPAKLKSLSWPSAVKVLRASCLLDFGFALASVEGVSRRKPACLLCVSASDLLDSVFNCLRFIVRRRRRRHQLTCSKPLRFKFIFVPASSSQAATKLAKLARLAGCC